MKRKKNNQWWANRIVEYGQRPANQFLAHELNARRHPAKQREALRGSLDSVGWIAPTVVSARTGKLLDGHARIEEALSVDEMMAIPFVEIDVSEAEEKLILAAFDPITGLATYDKDALSALLKEVQSDDARINDMLAELAGSVGLLLEDRTPGAGGDDYETTPDEEQTRVEYGDLWQCGEHRVLCGDSTKAEDVGRALGGARPALMVTDPPYGVDYDPEWRDEAAEKGLIAYAARSVGTVDNDDRIDWTDAWRLFSGDIAYCWHADRHASAVQSTLEQGGFEIRSQIIWAKSSFAISRGHYHWQHEPCWYAVRKGATAEWIGDRSQTTLWQINRDIGIEGQHSTKKPLECMARPIRNHAGDVYDPFLGSGTTLIAAQREGRKCYAVEIGPHYVNDSLSRWEAETGKAAQLLERRSLAQTG